MRRQLEARIVSLARPTQGGEGLVTLIYLTCASLPEKIRQVKWLLSGSHATAPPYLQHLCGFAYYKTTKRARILCIVYSLCNIIVLLLIQFVIVCALCICVIELGYYDSTSLPCCCLCLQTLATDHRKRKKLKRFRLH